MRIGNNPHKNKILQDNDFKHQIIIPIYIPNAEGYFKDGLKILQYCLGSLFKTIHSKTFVTLINNGSSVEVAAYLDELLAQKKIHELIHTVNCGKLNAILKGLSGNNFPLITIADADVLFLNDWQQETYRVFDAFPKAGAVCPTPSSKSYKAFTSNIWFELLFSKSLSCRKVKNPQALQAFADSIDNANFYNKYHKELYLTVKNEDTIAVVGGGHFLVTYKNEVFENPKTKFNKYKLGGDCEILDLPVLEKGLWRLSTHDNYAYHLGNIDEPWMEDVFLSLRQNDFKLTNDLKYKKIETSKLQFYIKYTLFSRFLKNKKIMKKLLMWKGLSKEAVKNY